jgi:putative transposase
MTTLTSPAAHGQRRALCHALDVAPATCYRARDRAQRATVTPRRPTPARALTVPERAHVLALLHEDRFVDLAPAQVYATLLDEGRYLCAERTMYRLLADAHEVRERRAQRRHPVYAAPELLATGPNQLWSWDITKLKGPSTWSALHLYVVLDVFSRYVVGWMLAPRESAQLAERLIATCCRREGITRGQLTIHADRGAAMTSTSVALLLAELGVTKTHSRPHVSNDNPYSEAQFKTLKYRPTFPTRFGSMEDARAYCTAFFVWYNTIHRHSGLGLHTPCDMHHGRAAARRAQRAMVLTAAYQATPHRFVNQPPVPAALPTAAWINPPAPPHTAPVTQ